MARGSGYEAVSATEETNSPTPPNPTASGSPATLFTVKVLDVRGATYELTVSASDTIAVVKKKLAVASEVEVERQRIIYAGRVLADNETLQSVKASAGSVLHLFQRPKNVLQQQAVSVRAEGAEGQTGSNGTSAAVDHSSTSTSSHGITLPDLVIQTAGGYAANPLYGHEAWMLEQSRRGMRLLASCLFLISTMQVLEALALISVKDPDSECNVAGPVFWILGRALLGMAVGTLGVRASHSMQPAAVRIYLIGLLITGVMAVAIRFDILMLVVSGKLPQCECVPTDSSDDGTDGTDSASSMGLGSSSAIGQPTSCHVTGAGPPKGMAIVFQTLLEVAVPALIWAWCFVRARQYGYHIISVSERESAEDAAAAAATAASASVGTRAESGVATAV